MTRESIEEVEPTCSSPETTPNFKASPSKFDTSAESIHDSSSFLKNSALFSHDESTLNGSSGGDSPVANGGPSYFEDDDKKELIPSTETAQTSSLGAVFLIVNAALGAGLLNLPKAFNMAGGVVPSVAVQAVLLVFILSALLILAKASDIKKSSTLQEVMYTVAGVWGRRATSAIIIVYCFGTCITFLIIIGDQFDRALASIVGPDYCHKWYYHRDFVMPLSSIFLILPLCYSKTIDYLKYASAFGVFIILYVVALICVEYGIGEHIPGPIRKSPDSWTDMLSLVPVICFSYQCHVSVIPIYSCMKKRNVANFSRASFTAIAICVFTYTGAATFGFLTFGDKVSEDIVSNYDASKPSVLLALIAISLKTFTTYPILLFCGREGLSTIIKDLFIKEDTEGKELVRRCTIVTVWFISTIILSIELPSIGIVIKLLGPLAAIFMFVFPGICLLRMSYDGRFCNSKFRTVATGCVSIAFIMLGFFLFGVVLTQSIIELVNNDKEEDLLCKPKFHGVQFYMKELFCM